MLRQRGKTYTSVVYKWKSKKRTGIKYVNENSFRSEILRVAELL